MRPLCVLAALAVVGSSATLIPSRSYHQHYHHQHRAHQHTKREVNGSYIASVAPYDNIFSDITDDEHKSVLAFLKREANNTIPGDIGFYEDQLMWLLAPNKTEATSYFNKERPKPERYARVLGSAECYEREYMVGPLPVDDSTKAMPLDWALGGNATLNNGYCGGNGTALTASSASDSGTRRPEEDVRIQKRNSLRSRSPHNPYEEKMQWNGDELPHDNKAPPVTILPDGARHEFDPEQNYVSWMDFSFFVATGPGGISLHDVHYKGDRVIYELAMQEALAHYAGPDQEQTFASYLDVTVGFKDFNLIPGYDCPSYATYTDAFCLFEFPKDYPMSRHMEWDYYHATKNIAFIVRSTSTVGNYDYQTTYEFHYDGTIQVLVRASGYIQASDLVNGTQPLEYGYRIREDLSGSMHDHVLNFKADLDIYGTKNSLAKTEFIPHSQVYPWSEGKVVNTMKADRSFVTNEDQGKINWAPNAAASYAVVNKDKPNDLGEYPGFRIYPSTGSPIHLTVENSTVFPNHLNWATHQLYALQRKDTEPVSAHPAGGYLLEETMVDFNDFFDGESLEQEDIVLYFNLGMHHMPDTYDLPVTVFQGAQSGITLRPQNYARSDSSISTRQQIHIKNVRNKKETDTYGMADLDGSFDLQSANPPWLPLPKSPVETSG